MEIFYRKEVDLDEENNFTLDISKDNNIEGKHFNVGEEYVISNLELISTEVDLTKWGDFKKIKAISDRINEAKEKKENNIKLGQILVYLPNFYDFKDELLLSPRMPKKIYKYINLKNKKIEHREFFDHQKVFESNLLTWKSTGSRKMNYKYLHEKNGWAIRNVIGEH